jgi:hypothetical protein
MRMQTFASNKCIIYNNWMQEALWTFHLLERSIHVNLLLVVHVLEPRVSFDMAKIDFGQLRIGSSSQRVVKLLNSEAEPFHFELDRNSLGDLGNSDTGPFLDRTVPCYVDEACSHRGSSRGNLEQ